jgi:hypothetical protein
MAIDSAAPDHTLAFAQLLTELHRQTRSATRVADHLLRLDLHELYEFGGRNPAALMGCSDAPG